MLYPLSLRSNAQDYNPHVLIRRPGGGAGGQGLRLCLCGLLSGLIGNRCGKAGGWAASQSSWEKLKTTAFLETGGITVGGREQGRDVRSERQRESFRAMWSLTRVSVEYVRLNRQGGFKGTVLQWLAKANKLQLYFQWKHKHTFTYTHTDMHTVNTGSYANVK